MVYKKVWLSIGAGAVLVALGAVTAVALNLTAANQADGPVVLTGNSTCADTDRTTSTITWTVENRRTEPATLIGTDGTDPAAITQSASGTQIPAAGPGGPGTVTFTQVVPGDAEVGFTATVGWDSDDTRETSDATVQPIDCRVPIAVGTLTATQPACGADDPGLDGTLLVEGAGSGMQYEVRADGGVPVVMQPGSVFTVVLDEEPVTAVVTPVVSDDSRLVGYQQDDWTVTFDLPADPCS